MGKSGQTVCHVRSRFFLLPRPASLCALQVTSAPMVVRARSWLPYTCRPAGPSLSKFNIFMEANEQEPYVPISFALCHHPSIPLQVCAHACTCAQDSLNSTEVQAHLYGPWVVFRTQTKKNCLIVFAHFRVCVCVYVCLFVCVCVGG